MMFLVIAAMMALPSLAFATKAGPDAYGYYYFDSLESDGPEYEWEELSVLTVDGDAKNYDLNADDVGPARSIGFDFEFYGNTYSEVYISSEGLLTFTETNNEGCCTGDQLPNPKGQVKNLVAALWGDLNPGG